MLNANVWLIPICQFFSIDRKFSIVSRCWWYYCKSLYQIEGWEADWNLITICASLLDSSWKRHLWCYQSGMIKAIDWKYSTNLRENTTKSTGLFFPNIGGVITKTFQQLPEWFPTFIVHHLRHSLPQGVLNVWGRVWHSWKFWYEWMSEYIRINKITRINIRIYSY